MGSLRLTHLHAHVLERRVRFYRQADHAIRSTQTQQHGCNRSIGVDARGVRLMVVVVVVMVGRISSFGGGNSGLNLGKLTQFKMRTCANIRRSMVPVPSTM